MIRIASKVIGKVSLLQTTYSHGIQLSKVSTKKLESCHKMLTTVSSKLWCKFIKIHGVIHQMTSWQISLVKCPYYKPLIHTEYN